MLITDDPRPSPRNHDIFTGTNPDGTVALGNTCNDWTSEGNADTARVGHTDFVEDTQQFSPSWNSAHDTESCSRGGVSTRGGAGLIYCFATD